jgi:hypothetical protein
VYEFSDPTADTYKRSLALVTFEKEDVPNPSQLWRLYPLLLVLIVRASTVP